MKPDPVDPAALPGGEKRLKFKSLASLQRYEALLVSLRSRWQEAGPMTDAEIVLAGLSDAASRGK